jgi:hypothetical protein
MIAEETTTTPQLEQLQKIARERLKTMNKSIVKLAKDNARLKEEDQSWECNGELNIGAALIYSSVRIDDMRFDTGETLRFDGSGWGVGLGATGSSIGSGIFNVSPSELLREKELKIQIFFATVGIGATEVSFWGNGGSRYLGIFVAGSLGAGLGSFGGDGKFEEA